MKIEYRVRPVTRYVVTRFRQPEDGNLAKSVVETKGEYDNFDIAYEVGYALCKAEHEQLGYPPDDSRVQYPKREAPPVMHNVTMVPVSAPLGVYAGGASASGMQSAVIGELGPVRDIVRT